eukprot:m.666999 g.666999  ORF g.666999 m.666999 type:complete len:57 (-) comp22751_c0_seq27:645-815(-)
MLLRFLSECRMLISSFPVECKKKHATTPIKHVVEAAREYRSVCIRACLDLLFNQWC